MDGACVAMTETERKGWGVPPEAQAFLVTYPGVREQIILLRFYDIHSDEHSVRAFTARQWRLAWPETGRRHA